MPKLSAGVVEAGREAERALPTFKGARPRTTPRKSEMKPVADKLPCDLCSGAGHPKYEVLKYNCRQRVWMCQHCRDNDAEAA